MLATEVEQSIVNLICYYEVFGPIPAKDVKESWIRLLLNLDVFDHRGRPLCRFWADGEDFNKKYPRGHHDGDQIRCDRYLDTCTDIDFYIDPDTGEIKKKRPCKIEKLSQAFRKFYIDASDPLIDRHDDSALLNALITFAAHACCVEHKHSKRCVNAVAEELLPIVKKWRRQYVFCEPPDALLVEEVLEVEPPGRVSGIFIRPFKKPKKHQRSRSVSPSSDNESFRSSLVPEKPLRPVSSAHDILNKPRRNASNASDWSVIERGRSRKEHFQALLKSTGLGSGRSTTSKRSTFRTGGRLSTIQAGGSDNRFSPSVRNG